MGTEKESVGGQLLEGRKAGGLGGKGPRGLINQTKPNQNLIDADSSMVITREMGVGEVEEDKGSINGDRRRLEFGW